MNPCAIFKLVVRLVGLFFLYKAVMAFTTLFSMADLPASMQHVQRPVLFHVMMLAAAAVWFLFGAHPIQDWAYPEADEKKKPSGPFCVSCEKSIPVGAKNCPACGWTQPG